MYSTRSENGITVSYDRYGDGPPLVLVHGSFTDHRTNWEAIAPVLDTRFTVHAVARRGRGATDASHGHGVEDEARDVAAVMENIGEPVFVLGHSYGAHVALAATLQAQQRVRRLMVYEPPGTHLPGRDRLSQLEALAGAGEWERFTETFFSKVLEMPADELEVLKSSEHWPDILEQAPPSLGDIQALTDYVFDPARFCRLRPPVTLQVGSESPRDLYVTDELIANLPHAQMQTLPDQAHEAMMTAPELYAEAVVRDLLGEEAAKRARQRRVAPQ